MFVFLSSTNCQHLTMVHCIIIFCKMKTHSYTSILKYLVLIIAHLHLLKSKFDKSHGHPICMHGPLAHSHSLCVCVCLHCVRCKNSMPNTRHSCWFRMQSSNQNVFVRLVFFFIVVVAIVAAVIVIVTQKCGCFVLFIFHIFIYPSQRQYWIT